MFSKELTLKDSFCFTGNLQCLGVGLILRSGLGRLLRTIGGAGTIFGAIILGCDDWIRSPSVQNSVCRQAKTVLHKSGGQRSPCGVVSFSRLVLVRRLELCHHRQQDLQGMESRAIDVNQSSSLHLHGLLANQSHPRPGDDQHRLVVQDRPLS